MLKRIVWILISIFWIGFIFFNSTRTATESSEASNTLLNLAQDILAVFRINIDSGILSSLIRKGAHFFEFFILGILIHKSIMSFYETNKFEEFVFIIQISLKFFSLAVLCICLFIAITDEHIQGYIDGRAKSVVDVFIDFAGSTTAIILMWFYNKKKIKSTLNIDCKLCYNKK